MIDNSITSCGDCLKPTVYKNENNLCYECSKYANKYYCELCQLNHKCNKGIWKSVGEIKSSPIEKLLVKFTQDILIEIEKIFVDMTIEINELKMKLESEKNNT